MTHIAAKLLNSYCYNTQITNEIGLMIVRKSEMRHISGFLVTYLDYKILIIQNVALKNIHKEFNHPSV